MPVSPRYHSTKRTWSSGSSGLRSQGSSAVRCTTADIATDESVSPPQKKKHPESSELEIFKIFINSSYSILPLLAYWRWTRDLPRARNRGISHFSRTSERGTPKQNKIKPGKPHQHNVEEGSRCNAMRSPHHSRPFANWVIDRQERERERETEPKRRWLIE